MWMDKLSKIELHINHLSKATNPVWTVGSDDKLANINFCIYCNDVETFKVISYVVYGED